MEAAVRAANELDVALKAYDICEERIEIHKRTKENRHDLEIFGKETLVASISVKIVLGQYSGAAIDAGKAIIGKIGVDIFNDEQARRLDKLQADELKNFAENVKNKLEELKAAIKSCRELFMDLLWCTSRYEPKSISLDFADFTDSEIHYHGSEGDFGFGDPIRHKEYSCKCRAQLERKTPSLTDDFGPWFEYFRKSPKLGEEIRDLVCTYEGEAQAYIMVNKVELIPLPEWLSNLKTEMQGGPVTIHFDISWSRFRPCEPLKFNVRFDGEEKLNITFTYFSSCQGQTHDLVNESNRATKLVMGLDPNKSYGWLGELESDSICRRPHKWTQKMERTIPDPEMGYAAWKATLEINVFSSGP